MILVLGASLYFRRNHTTHDTNIFKLDGDHTYGTGNKYYWYFEQADLDRARFERITRAFLTDGWRHETF
jgi:hypothetical protein